MMLSVEKIQNGCIHLEAPDLGVAEQFKDVFVKPYFRIPKENVPFEVQEADVLDVEIDFKAKTVKVIGKNEAERRRRARKRALYEALKK